MNKSYMSIGAVVVVVAMGIVGYQYMVRQYSLDAPLPTENLTQVHYQCEEGSIDALYGDTSVVLTFLDGRTVSLPQVMSGSGIRYEKDSTVFISKGNGAFLEEKGEVLYNNCIENSAAPATESETNEFVDGGATVRFSYPSGTILTGGELGYTPSWRTNTQTLGMVLAKVTIPKTLQPNTNVGDSWFTVGTSSDPVAIKECLIPTNGERAKGTLTVNGVVFTKITFTDAGMSQYYDTTSYRALHNDQCYALDYTIHSINMRVYSPEQGIKEFDTQKVVSALEGMVNSFIFLK